VAGERVWLLPRTDGPVDEFNDVVPSWPTGPNDAGAVPIDGAAVAFPTTRAGETATAGRETIDTDLRLFLPAGTRVGYSDRMWVRDDTYDVVGRYEDWVNPWRQVETGVVVNLNRTAG
jgi:hypothetical protein